jgi:glycosyltransferase involved in cell wall biosynthesis
MTNLTDLLDGRQRRLRIYANLRSAHLERLKAFVPADVLYSRANYDFERSLAPPSVLVHRCGRFRTATAILSGRYDIIEMNEPMMAYRWPDLVLQVVAAKLAGIARRRRVEVVAYCIEVADPADLLRSRLGLPHTVSRGVSAVTVNLIVRSMSRLAFGTEASRALYARYVGGSVVGARGSLIQALPAACGCLEQRSAIRERDRRVLFVGRFDDRKGIRQLMDAWANEARAPDAKLTLIGQGPLACEVQAFAASRREVEIMIDPPRAEIHKAYRESRVTVLLSQPSRGWREQVGLPIVEGLAHGCRVLSTTESGLSPWLHRAGHTIIPPSAPSGLVAAALSNALSVGPSVRDVLASLPETDGRLDADAWLMYATPRHPARPAGRLPGLGNNGQ